MEETISRIPKHYVRKDIQYAQVMIPYVNTLSIFDKNGIIFNQLPKSDFVNKYLEKSFRTLFPYHNIPNHIKRTGLFGRVNVTNQLLKFDEHYISIADGIVTDRYVMLDKDDALMLTKVLPFSINNEIEYSNNVVTMTREELDNLFKPSSENEKVYIVTKNAELYYGDNIGYLDEDVFLKRQQKKFYEQLKYSCGNMSNDTIEFIERKIDEMTIDDLRDYSLEPSVYLIKMDGNNIKIQLLSAYLEKSDKYTVTIKNIPLNKYILEQLKFMSPNIIEIKEPKISLRLNPGITQDDLDIAKEMVFKRRSRN